MLGVIGGVEAFCGVGRTGNCFETIDGEVAVKLDHGGFGCDGLGAVDLDLIVVLRVERCGKKAKDRDEEPGEMGPVSAIHCLLSWTQRVLTTVSLGQPAFFESC